MGMGYVRAGKRRVKEMYFGKKTVKGAVHGAGKLGSKMVAKAKSLGRKFAGGARMKGPSVPGMRGGGMSTLPMGAAFKRRRM